MAKDFYCSFEEANIRYPSDEVGSLNGWVYLLVQDEELAFDLSIKHKLEVKNGDEWQSYLGFIPDTQSSDQQEPSLWQSWADMPGYQNEN